jgi:hypothetical protein
LVYSHHSAIPQAEIGAVDAEEVFHFFDVVPSTG